VATLVDVGLELRFVGVLRADLELGEVGPVEGLLE
jgi:hypothetical protein